MEGGKKVCVVLAWSEDHDFMKKMRFGASYSTSNKLLLVATHSDYGPPKMPLKLAV